MMTKCQTRKKEEVPSICFQKPRPEHRSGQGEGSLVKTLQQGRQKATCPRIKKELFPSPSPKTGGRKRSRVKKKKAEKKRKRHSVIPHPPPRGVTEMESPAPGKKFTYMKRTLLFIRTAEDGPEVGGEKESDEKKPR